MRAKRTSKVTKKVAKVIVFLTRYLPVNQPLMNLFACHSLTGERPAGVKDNAALPACTLQSAYLQVAMSNYVLNVVLPLCVLIAFCKYARKLHYLHTFTVTTSLLTVYRIFVAVNMLLLNQLLW